MTIQKLNAANDERVSYDDETGAVRSFFGAELVDTSDESGVTGATAASLSTENKTDVFLETNRELFKLDDVSLERVGVREGSATKSVRYRQQHHGLPVYGAELTVGVREHDGSIVSAVNKIDYRIPEALRPEKARLTSEDAAGKVRALLRGHAADTEVGEPELFVYRHTAAEQEAPPHGPTPFWKEMTGLGTGTPGNVYLVWQVFADTESPDGNWELLLDAAGGDVVAVFDRRSYAKRRAYVFMPDPVTSSQKEELTWDTGADVLDPQRVEVTLEDLDEPAAGGKCRLSGKWVRCVDKEKADFAPPESEGDFMFGSKDREFLFTMTYYWADHLIKYLRGFGVKTFNEKTDTPFEMDALGLEKKDASGNPQKSDNSHFTFNVGGKPYIAFGEGGVPDASDAHVIVHEYGHALHYFLGSRQGGYEEGFGDFLAGAWLDRFNKKQFQRAKVFPWDNNKTLNWGPKRRLDLTEKFSDAGFDGYGKYLKGNILATALWDLFLSVGGREADESKRAAAADAVVHLYMEMLLLVSGNATPNQLANGLIEADKSINGSPEKPEGKYRQQIWDAFKERGLWTGDPPGAKVEEVAAHSATEVPAAPASGSLYPPIPWDDCEIEGEIEIRMKFRTRSRARD